MKRALDRYVIRGPRHNVNFLRDVLENERFNAGRLTTKFIAEEYPKGFHGHRYTQAELDDVLAVAAVMIFRRELRAWEIEGQQATASIPEDLGRVWLSLPSLDNQTVETEVRGLAL